MSLLPDANAQESLKKINQEYRSQIETSLRLMSQINELEDKVRVFSSFHSVVSQQVEHFSFFGGPAKYRAIKEACANLKAELKL